MKTQVINGITFEVHHTSQIKRYLNIHIYAWNKGQFDIYDVYERPSRAKVEIFEEQKASQDGWNLVSFKGVREPGRSQ